MPRKARKSFEDFIALDGEELARILQPAFHLTQFLEQWEWEYGIEWYYDTMVHLWLQQVNPKGEEDYVGHATREMVTVTPDFNLQSSIFYNDDEDCVHFRQGQQLNIRAEPAVSGINNQVAVFKELQRLGYI